MRRLLLLGAIFLGLAGTAQADTPADTPPPATWQKDALDAAFAYWQTQGHTTPWLPGCQMTVTYAPLPQSTEAGETVDYCNIIIDDSEGFLYPNVLCLDVTHEVGHVMLGPDAFPNNPSDPTHSPDPNNIMYFEVFSQKTSQCTAMLNAIYPPIRHRAKRRRATINAGFALIAARLP